MYFSLFWSGGIFIILTLLISLIPLKVGALGTIKSNILSSKSYEIINDWFGDSIPITNELSSISEIFSC